MRKRKRTRSSLGEDQAGIDGAPRGALAPLQHDLHAVGPWDRLLVCESRTPDMATTASSRRGVPHSETSLCTEFERRSATTRESRAPAGVDHVDGLFLRGAGRGLVHLLDDQVAGVDVAQAAHQRIVDGLDLGRAASAWAPSRSAGLSPELSE